MTEFYDGVSDCDLQALVDNEVSSGKRASLMLLLKTRPAAMRRLEALLYQKQILKQLWCTLEK